MYHPSCPILCTKIQLLHVFDPKPNSVCSPNFVWSKRSKWESMNPSFRKENIDSLWGMTVDNVEAVSCIEAVVIWCVHIWTHLISLGKGDKGWSHCISCLNCITPNTYPMSKKMSRCLHPNHHPSVMVSNMNPSTLGTYSYSRFFSILQCIQTESIQPMLDVFLKGVHIPKWAFLCIWVKVLMLTIIKYYY